MYMYILKSFLNQLFGVFRNSVKKNSFLTKKMYFADLRGILLCSDLLMEILFSIFKRSINLLFFCPYLSISGGSECPSSGRCPLSDAHRTPPILQTLSAGAGYTNSLPHSCVQRARQKENPW